MKDVAFCRIPCFLRPGTRTHQTTVAYIDISLFTASENGNRAQEFFNIDGENLICNAPS